MNHLTPSATLTVEDPWALPLDAIDPSEGRIFEAGRQHEYFRRLRQEDPVHYTANSPFGPYWSITKFNDIVEVDSNHAVFSSAGNIFIGDQPAGFAPPMFITSDPPIHGPQRKAVAPAVAPQRLSELEALVRSRAVAILESLPRGETFNWVQLVSKELTTQMLATLFDFPWEDRHLLPYWSDLTSTADIVGAATADMAERERGMREYLAYFTRLWHERAALPPKFDFISLMAHNPATKHYIDAPMAFLGNLSTLIVGGNDTTRNSISGGLLALNLFPAEYEKLINNPALVPNMVSEIIRWQSPVAHMRRTALSDYELGDKQIRKGDKVVMWYVSGNRDETVIDRPDEFIIDRPNARHHLSFGFGIHRCLGNRMGELQLRVLWEEILARFPRIEVVGEPIRVESNFAQGYSTLQVRIPA